MNYGHNTNECDVLKDEIERLVRAGHLQKYVKEEGAQTRSSPREKSLRRSPEQSYQRDDQSQRHNRSRSCGHEHERSIWGHINTISGDFEGGGASSSARRKHLMSLKIVHMVDRQP